VILGIDTAGARGGIALLSGAEPPLRRDLGDRGRHAESLVPAVEAALASAGATWSDLDLVAVNVGPGSFTGIRVGIASALGLGAASGIPVTGVGCLDILARACYSAMSPPTGAYIVSVADVRRGEVVAGRFVVEDAGLVRIEEDRLLSVTEAGAPPPGLTLLAGDGAGLLWPEHDAVERWTPSGPERAVATAQLGDEQQLAGCLEDPTPRYFRQADARPRRAER
jgi:tRNA threonylcarbamoyladenosine biosynthesis protein TsaB